MRYNSPRRQRHQLSAEPIQRLFTAGLIVVLLTIAGIAAVLVFDRAREIAASALLPEFSAPRVEATPTLVFDPLKIPRWRGVERVNILLMGIDQRDYEEGPWRTDTMIVLTIDPVTLSAGMLSIPRDLWVPIPGFQEGRINTAHYLGEVYDYPGGGPALAVKTVEYNLGVPIHYYVRANFTAFEKVIDLIGGIDIEVKEEINDPFYPARDGPGYDPLYIPAGRQHFDGEMALKYARTRHTAGGDFDRARRQQQVILAVFDKVTRLEMLPQLVVQAPQLWATLQEAIVTDMTLEEMVALANLATEIKPEKIRYSVIDEHYTQFWSTPDGQQVLIPLRDAMRELRDYVFTTQAEQPEAVDPLSRLQAEAATIEVLNGTTREGLARSTADYLEQSGLSIARTDNADLSDYANSLIIVHRSGKDYTAEYIARLLNLPLTAIIHGANDPTAAFDITVILGLDYQLPASATPTSQPTS